MNDMTLHFISVIIVGLLVARILWQSDKPLLRMIKKLQNEIKSLEESIKVKNNRIENLVQEKRDLFEVFMLMNRKQKKLFKN